MSDEFLDEKKLIVASKSFRMNLKRNRYRIESIWGPIEENREKNQSPNADRSRMMMTERGEKSEENLSIKN